MTQVTSEARAWQLMQYAEEALQRGQFDACQRYTDMARCYFDTIDAEETLGFTAWFSHADNAADSTGLALDFTIMQVGNATAAANAEVTWDFGAGNVPAVTNKALTTNVATITFASAHNLEVGQVVTVAIGDAVFDGVQTITAVAAGTISYAKVNANVASAAATGTAKITGQSVMRKFPATGSYFVTMRVAPAAPSGFVVVSARTVKVPYDTAS